MNNKLIGYAFVLALFWGIFNFNAYVGKIKVLFAPKINSNSWSESPLPYKTQSDLYLDFEYKICKSFTPCAASTFSNDSDKIIFECALSLDKLNKIKINEGFSKNIKENMNLFLTSMKNSVRRNINRQEMHHSNKSGDHRGESFISQIFNWEIDTCTEKSIPQKLRQIYGFSKFSPNKIIDCKDIEAYYEAQYEK